VASRPGADPPDPAPGPLSPAPDPRPRAVETLKLRFDMAKQVLAICATVLSLILIAAKGSDGKIAIDWLLESVCASLFASLVIGMLVLGRHVSLSARDDVAPGYRTLAGLGIPQHAAFLLGMALVFGLIVHAGTSPAAAPRADVCSQGLATGATRLPELERRLVRHKRPSRARPNEAAGRKPGEWPLRLAPSRSPMADIDRERNGRFQCGSPTSCRPQSVYVSGISACLQLDRE